MESIPKRLVSHPNLTLQENNNLQTAKSPLKVAKTARKLKFIDDLLTAKIRH
jgi:hypothetical protein